MIRLVEVERDEACQAMVSRGEVRSAYAMMR
jgi:hypothetical protein